MDYIESYEAIKTYAEVKGIKVEGFTDDDMRDPYSGSHVYSENKLFFPNGLLLIVSSTDPNPDEEYDLEFYTYDTETGLEKESIYLENFKTPPIHDRVSVNLDAVMKCIDEIEKMSKKAVNELPWANSGR